MTKSLSRQQPVSDSSGEPRTVQVERKVLDRNDTIAEQNRAWLHSHGIVTLNLISSPGSGKTALLETTLDRLRGRIECSVIVGDQQTDRDAMRLLDRGAPVRQIETRNSCHLNAEQIQNVLPDVVTPKTQLLFIENIGNLVCPAAFDLGEDSKIALVSTPEGEDKAVKYPVLFSGAALVVVTKTDLAPFLGYDLEQCRNYIRQVQPGVPVIELSSRSGDGLDAWIAYLIDRLTPAVA